MSRTNQDVIIIGGGILGLACAHYLTERAVRVRILERTEVGAGATHGNCGLLHFSGVIPLCAPGVVKHELRRALTGSSPLRIKPRLDAGLWSWLFRFARHCTVRHREQGSTAKDALMKFSRRLFDELFASHPLECDFARKGLLLLFRETENFENYQKTNAILERYDFAAQPLSGAATRDLEPAVGDRVAGAWYNQHDWHLRPDALAEAWKKLLLEQGVAIEESCRVTGFQQSGGTIREIRTERGAFRADSCILATGAWSPQLAGQLELRIPVQPGKGYSITMPTPENAPRIPCLLQEASMVATPWASGYRLGGTMEFSGVNDHLDEKRLDRLLRGASGYLRTAGDQPQLERWSGLRPMCYDDLPVIGRPKHYTNLYLATGHGMLGLTMATGTGRALAELLCEGHSSIDLHPFSPDRFHRGA